MSGHFIRRRRRKLERKIAQTVHSHCTAVVGTVYTMRQQHTEQKCVVIVCRRVESNTSKEILWRRYSKGNNTTDCVCVCDKLYIH